MYFCCSIKPNPIKFDITPSLHMLHKATPVDASYKYFKGEEPNKQGQLVQN